ncbi:VOC family protein [Shewanella woodyi]|uniref:Glyoxalase/bleomycin resistance protein/dioxygenase n=1 Tax=Shewanella woodyi (strain ATCC 51908 / MS32) TaxID=392500 RepID=B1KGL1_SHEWM|nr:VOC family protein [Shewanella woodyi]ACA85339.1 Glyoxalase/bleomycin resistance protein/dioxygenase [Shewanella woodyi ATCC 51908]
MNMNQVTFPVNDMHKATEFYRLMGFIQIVDTPHYARFECSDGHASFSLSLQPEEQRNYGVIYFEHQNLDQLVAQLIEKGFHFDQMPTMESYLWREAVLHDPSGNKIKLYWAGENRLNPPWRVQKDKQEL